MSKEKKEEKNKGSALVNQIELQIADQARVLRDWETKRKPALQCLEGLDQFTKEIKEFKEAWYDANFMSHYYLKILLNAVGYMVNNNPEAMANIIEMSAGRIALDKTLAEYAETQAEAAQKEDQLRELEGKRGPGVQMKIFDAMTERGVATIIDFCRSPEEQELYDTYERTSREVDAMRERDAEKAWARVQDEAAKSEGVTGVT